MCNENIVQKKIEENICWKNKNCYARCDARDSYNEEIGNFIILISLGSWKCRKAIWSIRWPECRQTIYSDGVC